VTAVLDATPEKATVDTAPEPPTASWLARAGAFSIDVLLGVGKRHDADRGALPDIVEIELRYGDIELAAKTILEAAENLTLVL